LLNFDQQLDAATVEDADSWDFRAAGAEGLFDTADDAIYDLQVSTTYDPFGTSVQLYVQNGPPMDSDDYRFTATAMLTDMVGNALDGDGDSTGGDASTRLFSLDLTTPVAVGNSANNDRATATPFPLTEDPADSGLFLGFGLGSIDPSSDQDWWSFAAEAGDRVAVALDTPDSGLRAQLHLYGATGGYLTRDYYGNAGPDENAYISHYAIPCCWILAPTGHPAAATTKRSG